MVTSDSPDPGSDSMRELGLRTVLCSPLWSEAGRIGVLYVDARKGDQEVHEGSLPFFAALARHIGLAVENARLRPGCAWRGSPAVGEPHRGASRAASTQPNPVSRQGRAQGCCGRTTARSQASPAAAVRRIPSPTCARVSRCEINASTGTAPRRISSRAARVSLAAQE